MLEDARGQHNLEGATSKHIVRQIISNSDRELQIFPSEDKSLNFDFKLLQRRSAALEPTSLRPMSNIYGQVSDLRERNTYTGFKLVKGVEASIHNPAIT